MAWQCGDGLEQWVALASRSVALTDVAFPNVFGHVAVKMSPLVVPP